VDPNLGGLVQRPSPLLPIVLLLAGSAGPARADLTRDYVSLALQGDLRRAEALFRDAGPLEGEEKELQERFEARFLRGEAEPLPDGTPPLQVDLIRAYRDYWNEALRNGWDTEAGEPRIRAAVGDVLARNGIVVAPGADVLEAMKEAVEAGGGHLLGGVTRPHFDLMIWADEETRHFDVQLTDGPTTVEVAFIGDFLVTGWSHWATFGRAYTGGWTESDRLVCLKDDYDLDSEKFRVSYLQHEARHFVDIPHFPNLQQPDLEYRAKLTELIYAESSLPALVRHFAGAGELNPAAPHAWANRCVIRDVSRELFGEDVPDADDARWTGVSASAVHVAARHLLDQHDTRLAAAEAATVRSLVGPE
jgi:hypothetical protein